MASRYFKNGATTWNTANNWSSTSASGVDNAGVPTAADDVIFELLSGSCQINVNAVCRSLDCTSGVSNYTGTISYDTSARTLTIGTSTAGANSVALKLVSGMTFTRSGTGNTITFSSTSGTQQSVDFAGFTVGNKTFSGAGGNWQITGTIFADTDTTVSHSAGTLDINSKSFTCAVFSVNSATTRTLTLGTGNTITITNTGGNGFTGAQCSNLTVTANTATFLLNGAVPSITIATTNGSPDFNGLTISLNGFTGTATLTLGSSVTFGALTVTGPASNAGFVSLSANVTFTGNITLTGNAPEKRFLLQSTILGTQRTITCNGTVTPSNVDFQDINCAGSASWDFHTTAAVGDCQGNTGFTGTTAVSRFKVATGNWDTTASWSATTGGGSGATVPLPQDSVTFDGNTPAGSHAQNAYPRLCKDFTNSSRTLTVNATSFVYGNITFSSTALFSGNNNMTFRGRGAQTISMGGISFPNTVTIDCVSGTYTAQDAQTFARNTAAALGLTSGTYNDGGQSQTINGAASTFAMTGGTLTASGSWSHGTTSAVSYWNVTGGTVVHSGTITLTATTANTRTFAGFGQTYGTVTYTVAGSTGQLTVTGSNTFARINFSDVTNARTLQFTSGTTNTITIPNIFGTAAKLMTVSAVTAASATTIQSTQPGNIGLNSTSVSGNTGITVAAGTYMDYLSVQDITWVQLASVRQLAALGAG